MLKPALILLAAAILAAQPAFPADYACADKEKATKLNDYDITIKKREDAIAEMQAEIKDGGGSTEQQNKALESFQQKLATVKADREKLLGECAAK